MSLQAGNPDLGELDGLCYHAHRIVAVSEDLEGKALHEAVVHELLHACFPYLSEVEVDESARSVSRALWKVYGPQQLCRENSGTTQQEGQ